MSGIHRRALRRAADILGGTHALCDYLQVPASDMRLWLEGSAVPPTGIFFRVVDLIVGEGPSRPEPCAPLSEDDRPEQA